jgi:HNH endonuclease
MSSYVNPEIRQVVAARANFVCEYCLIAEADAYFKHQVEHIISRKHGGSSDLENLALACVSSNRYKGSDIASLKPVTKEVVRLYNPRLDRWREHFRLTESLLDPLTEIGEATIRILQMNHDDQVLERRVLCRRGRYPSESALLLTTDH